MVFEFSWQNTKCLEAPEINIITLSETFVAFKTLKNISDLTLTIQTFPDPHCVTISFATLCISMLQTKINLT